VKEEVDTAGTGRVRRWNTRVRVVELIFMGENLLDFGVYQWRVKQSPLAPLEPHMGPGPNVWSSDNVQVRPDGGGLQLSIVKRNGTWTCGEVTLNQSLGFGTYEFEVTGRPDLFDRNVVLGLFSYLGPDDTNEIDIELAKWGMEENDKRLNWVVYPQALGTPKKKETNKFALNGDASTHCYTWTPRGVLFQCFHGYQKVRPIAPEYNGQPEDWERRIPEGLITLMQGGMQVGMPVSMNLWLYQGCAPSNDEPVEITIRAFRFTPPAV